MLVWGPLQIRGEVGSGTFGTVYRAWDTRLEREVALKLLKPEDVRLPTASAAIKEGRLLARIRHPNVVTVYGADAHDGRVGVWMEFVTGRTLKEILDHEGPFSPLEASLVGTELCHALAAVHQKGFLHRDIKAQNVMREAGRRTVLPCHGPLTGRTARPARSPRPHVAAGRPAGSAGGFPARRRPGDGGRPRRPSGERGRDGAPSRSAAADAECGVQRLRGRSIEHRSPARRRSVLVRTASSCHLRDGPGCAGSRGLGGSFGYLRNFSPTSELGRHSSVQEPHVRRRRERLLQRRHDGRPCCPPGLASRSARDFRSVTRRYKNRTRTEKEIGADLGVAAVLDGSVRQSGDRIRIVSQLIDAQSGEQLWSESFEGDLKDIFTMQSHLGRLAAARGHLHLSRPLRPGVRRLRGGSAQLSGGGRGS